MTLTEIAQQMLKDIDKYTTTQEVDVPKLVQARTHNKKRINKQWAKRYGQRLIYVRTRARVADITVDNVIEFCREKNLPLPDEFINNTTK
jgi:hypothetical protein